MTLKYFTDANSAAGYVSLQKENLTGISTIYHLKGPDASLVHHLLARLSNSLVPQQLNPEYIYSTFNPKFLAGLVIRELDIAFTSGKNVLDEAGSIDLMPAYEASTVTESQDKINQLQIEAEQYYEKMYMHLNAALHIHDEWEKIYIDRMDFEKANQFRKGLIERLFETEIPPTLSLEDQSASARVVRRFFGASTPDGLSDFIPELTSGLKRYLIKGRPGSGKSTLMKEVVAKAVALGYDADVYHCSLDPKSLDMVVIPELNFCIFDATAPHAYEATFVKDEIVDTYSAFIRQGTDERCADILEAIENKYKNQLRLALLAMGNGHDCLEALSSLYKTAMVTEKVDEIVARLADELLSRKA